MKINEKIKAYENLFQKIVYSNMPYYYGKVDKMADAWFPFLKSVEDRQTDGQTDNYKVSSLLIIT